VTGISPLPLPLPRPIGQRGNRPVDARARVSAADTDVSRVSALSQRVEPESDSHTGSLSVAVVWKFVPPPTFRFPASRASMLYCTGIAEIYGRGEAHLRLASSHCH